MVEKSGPWIIIIAILCFGGFSYALLFHTKWIRDFNAGRWKEFMMKIGLTSWANSYHSEWFFKLFGIVFMFVTLGLVYVFVKRLGE
jgi:hypothetical protein